MANSAQLRQLLATKTSFTQALQRYFNAPIHATLQQQSTLFADHDLALQLNIAPRTACWRREVILSTPEKNVARAVSYIPVVQLTGPARRIRYLGDHPLMRVLFKHPCWQRKTLHIDFSSQTHRWQRVSTFCYHHKQLLLIEQLLTT